MDQNYECPRCHYSTNVKCNILKHLIRAEPCKTLYSNIERSLIIEDINKKPSKEFVCEVCTKSYAFQSGLLKHLKSHTQEEIEIAKANQNIETVVHGDNNNVVSTIDNSVDNSVDNSIHIENLTINILPFGKELTDHVESDTQLLDECVKNISLRGIPNIVKAIFFNDDVPQNQNVKIGRERNPPQMLVFNEQGKWESQDRQRIIHDMIVKGHGILVAYNNEIFHIDQICQLTNDQKDLLDFRNLKLSQISSKARGVYAPIKNAILDLAKNNN